MKVIFDQDDLNEKLARLLEMDGLRVTGGIDWGTDIDDRVSVMMNIVPIPPDERTAAEEESPEQRLANLIIRSLEGRFEDLGNLIESLAANVPAGSSPAAFVKKHGKQSPKGKTGGRGDATVETNLEGDEVKRSILASRTRLELEKEKIAREQDMSINPFTNQPVRPRRPGPNESEEYPG